MAAASGGTTTIPASLPTLPQAASANSTGVTSSAGTRSAIARIAVGIKPAPSATATPISITSTRPSGSKCAKLLTKLSTNHSSPAPDSRPSIGTISSPRGTATPAA